MTLTILAAGRAHPDKAELRAENGFSAHAAMDGLEILCDFGSSKTVLHNSRVLGIDLKKVDVGVLSHGHLNHAGDLGNFFKENPRARVFHGRGAFHPRWRIIAGQPKDVSVPLIPTDEVVERLSAVDRVMEEEQFTILPAASGHLNRPLGNMLLLAGAEGSRLPDDFTDELTLLIKTEAGLVVLSGCFHRGILNIAVQIRTYCPNCVVAAFIGGFHLLDGQENDDELRHIAERLAELYPDARVIAGDCMEEAARGIAADVFKDRFESFHVGRVMQF